MIAFNDRKNQTHELSLTVHDSGPGWNVWLATVGEDTRYFEADDGVEVWDLIDMAAHCYDEPEILYTEEEVLDSFPGLDIEKLAVMSYLEGKSSNRMDQAGARAEMFKEYTRAGQSLPQTVEGADLKRLSEMDEEVFENNANKVDFLTVVDENGAPWFNVETAPKIEYPALYRKLLSPEEFTD